MRRKLNYEAPAFLKWRPKTKRPLYFNMIAFCVFFMVNPAVAATDFDFLVTDDKIAPSIECLQRHRDDSKYHVGNPSFLYKSLFLACVGKSYDVCIEETGWTIHNFRDCMDYEAKIWKALSAKVEELLRENITTLYGERGIDVLNNTKDAWRGYSPECSFMIGIWPEHARARSDYSYECSRDAGANRAIHIFIWNEYITLLRGR